MKTIAIDARFYGIAHTGIGRYTENLISNLPQDKNIQIVLLVSKADFNHPQLQSYRRIPVLTHPYSPLSQLEMIWVWLKTRPDLLHVPYSSIPVFWPGRLVTTFHDLIKHLSKGTSTSTKNPLVYWIKYWGYLFVDWISLRRSHAIIVPSRYWQEILIKKYPYLASKVFVTYESVAQDFSQTIPEKIPNFQISSPFVVHTGNLYPHKNIEVLVKAIKRLNGKVNLVLICARSVFSQRAMDLIKAEHLEKQVFFLGRLTDAQVIWIYKKALAFVFPSKIEGFGLPGLEAMSVGLPVIAAQASCLPEIYQQAALYFDPDNPEELSQKITYLISHPQIRKNLIEKGFNQTQKFSWSKMGKLTWEIYQKTLP